MIATLRSELIKLKTVRSTWIATAVFIVLSLGLGLSTIALSLNSIGLDPSNATALFGLVRTGFIVLAILGALSITSEYGTGLLGLTFQATPNRLRLMTAKVLVTSVFAGVLGLVVSVGLLAVGHVMVVGHPHADIGFAGADFTLLAIAVTSVFSVVGAMGVGGLLRSTPATVAVVILWASVMEGMLASLPHVSQVVAPFLPFLNAYHAINGDAGATTFHWGQVGGLLYFMATATVLFIAGSLVVNRRPPR